MRILFIALLLVGCGQEDGPVKEAAGEAQVAEEVPTEDPAEVEFDDKVVVIDEETQTKKEIAFSEDEATGKPDTCPEGSSIPSLRWVQENYDDLKELHGDDFIVWTYNGYDSIDRLEKDEDKKPIENPVYGVYSSVDDTTLDSAKYVAADDEWEEAEIGALNLCTRKGH